MGDPDRTPAPASVKRSALASGRSPPPPGAVLGGMAIRKKLIVLHTVFSLGLAAMLLVALRPAITEVVEQAEIDEASLLLRLAMTKDRASGSTITLDTIANHAVLARGPAEKLGLDPSIAALARNQPNTPLPTYLNGRTPAAVVFVPGDTSGSPNVSTPIASPPNPATESSTPPGEYITASRRIEDARAAIWRLYGLVIAALLAVYAFVAASLEIFVLPKNVYGPIQRMLEADAAARAGDARREIIPAELMPADELGQIMRSRNQTIQALRDQERQLGEALAELERVATDLKRKNHLLEAAKRNLADADRLASLGTMSAGIAHELNTPLAVIKGLVERLDLEKRQPAAQAPPLTPADTALMLRVVGRLERLSESLLDFARVRPPVRQPTSVRAVVDEAITLVRLDRETSGLDIRCNIPETLIVGADGDRLIQVFVNLLRNAVDAMKTDRLKGHPPRPRFIDVDAEQHTREDGQSWASISVGDNGPGIDPEVLARIFEPFVSSKLDANGTGLGLAVAEGIVREHGGLILARNKGDRAGAIFEVMLPVENPDQDVMRQGTNGQPESLGTVARIQNGM